MLQSLIDRLLSPSPARTAAPDAALALAALLVRVARSDHLYAAEEVERIDRILVARFSLDPFGAAALRARAEEMESAAPDSVRFTRALKEAVALDERIGLMEALWSVALSDGLRGADEDQLLRLFANLLGLSDIENARARRRAEARA